ncbi:hypothetical protein PHYBOEH_006313 [Phytophthora boehmeriae]|uniref:Uncharacterized protein n=1 Tax=Phytophthora boehmeriae TaxID=109152 RepID=A0A8T1WLV1_9STRA|nr:hypothetical protein PHYBOEH_006313 [Phytophthora boehmeriae]
MAAPTDGRHSLSLKQDRALRPTRTEHCARQGQSIAPAHIRIQQQDRTNCSAMNAPSEATPADSKPSSQQTPPEGAKAAPKSPAQSPSSLLKSPSAFEQKPLRMPKPMSI